MSDNFTFHKPEKYWPIDNKVTVTMKDWGIWLVPACAVVIDTLRIIIPFFIDVELYFGVFSPFFSIIVSFFSVVYELAQPNEFLLNTFNIRFNLFDFIGWVLDLFFISVNCYLSYKYWPFIEENRYHDT